MLAGRGGDAEQVGQDLVVELREERDVEVLLEEGGRLGADAQEGVEGGEDVLQVVLDVAQLVHLVFVVEGPSLRAGLLDQLLQPPLHFLIEGKECIGM